MLFEIKWDGVQIRPILCSYAVRVQLKTSVSVVHPTVSLGCMKIVDGSFFQSLIVGKITSGTCTSGADPLFATDEGSNCDSCALLRRLGSVKAQNFFTNACTCVFDC